MGVSHAQRASKVLQPALPPPSPPSLLTAAPPAPRWLVSKGHVTLRFARSTFGLEAAGQLGFAETILRDVVSDVILCKGVSDVIRSKISDGTCDAMFSDVIRNALSCAC